MPKKGAKERREPQAHVSSTHTISNNHVTPILHAALTGPPGEAGCWSGPVGAVTLGVVDPPVGAGVVVARHRSRKPQTA